MGKKKRIKNNFSKWTLRSVPFFLVLFFVFINVAVFCFQPKSFLLQSSHGWDKNHQEKQIRLMSFESIYAAKYMSEITDQLQVNFITKDDYPRKLKELHIDVNNKNWIYNPTFKNYDLIFRKK